MKQSTKLTLLSLCTGAIAGTFVGMGTLSDNKMLRIAATPVAASSTAVGITLLTLGVSAAIAEQVEKRRKRRQEEEIEKPIGIPPEFFQPYKMSEPSPPFIPVACRTCRNLCSGWNTGLPSCFRKGEFETEEGGWDCQDFAPIYPACALFCSYHFPVLEGIGEHRERELQAALERPIQIKLTDDWDGSRDVAIAPPWGDFAEGAYDITLGDGPSCQVNTEGGIRLAATGHEDYYCNVGARETNLFAWEMALAAAIAENLETFERFWADPQAFVDAFPNPDQYKITISGQEHLQSWVRL